MAWTAPSTWVAAAVLTAAQLNEQIRDNLLYLKGRTQVGTGSVTTVAGSVVSVAVTFPTAFASAPKVTVTPVFSSPQLISTAIATGTSATSFTVNMYRTSGSGAVTFHWHASLG